MSDEKTKKRPPSSMTDDEFAAWWPFDDDDLDEYEREIEESLKDYKILPDPGFEEKKKRAEETAHRTLDKKHPGRMTEDQRKLLPPGLLAYWRGEAPTPYTDPTGWDEFRKILTLADDLGRLVPINESDDATKKGHPNSD